MNYCTNPAIYSLIEYLGSARTCPACCRSGAAETRCRLRLWRAGRATVLPGYNINKRLLKKKNIC